MAFNFVVFATLLAAANAGLLAAPQLAYPAPLAYSTPIAKIATPLAAPLFAAPVTKVATPILTKTLVSEDYDPHPQYSYGYDVQDGLTGDNKEQHEQRDGDIVTGRYALNDPDGYRRIVEYTSDPLHGFNAVVRREPLSTPVVTKVATPVAQIAPVLARVATPLTYSAPIVTKTVATPLSYAAPAQFAYAAPVAKIAAPLTYAAPTYYHH